MFDAVLLFLKTFYKTYHEVKFSVKLALPMFRTEKLSDDKEIKMVVLNSSCATFLRLRT